jgi:hypothetical protein
MGGLLTGAALIFAAAPGRKIKPPGVAAGRFVKRKKDYFFFLPEFFMIARETLPFLSMKYR